MPKSIFHGPLSKKKPIPEKTVKHKNKKNVVVKNSKPVVKKEKTPEDEYITLQCSLALELKGIFSYGLSEELRPQLEDFINTALSSSGISCTVYPVNIMVGPFIFKHVFGKMPEIYGSVKIPKNLFKIPIGLSAKDKEDFLPRQINSSIPKEYKRQIGFVSSTIKFKHEN